MKNRFFARNRYLFDKSWIKSTIFAVCALLAVTFASWYHYGQKVTAYLKLEQLNWSLVATFFLYFLVVVVFSLVAGGLTWFVQYYVKELQLARYREEELQQDKLELELCISNLVSEHEQRIASYKHQLTSARQQQQQQQLKIGELEQELAKISEKADSLCQQNNSLNEQQQQAQVQIYNLEQKLAQTTKIAQSVPFLRQKINQAEEDEKYFAEDYSRLSAENHQFRMRNSQLERQNQSLSQDLTLAQQNIKVLSQFCNSQQQTLVQDEPQQDDDSLDCLFAFTLEAIKTLDELSQSDSVRYKRVHKALRYMSTNLRHQSLRSHKYQTRSGPSGEDVFECYVDNGSSGAWRIFWYYGPGEKFRTIDSIEPHG